jgi:hypothetical protein
MTELKGAEPQEDRIMAIIKTLSKLVKKTAEAENMTALTRASGDCKRHTHPLVREGCPTVIKIWSCAPD